MVIYLNTFKNVLSIYFSIFLKIKQVVSFRRAHIQASVIWKKETNQYKWVSPISCKFR